MAKKVLLLLLVMTFAHKGAAQDLFDYNKTFEVNIGYNSCGGFRPLIDRRIHNISGMSASLSLWGFYLGFISNTQGIDGFRDMGLDTYPGYVASTLHIGYSIPLCSWAKITPIIGWSKWANGYYDGSDWGVDSNGIYNKFHSLNQYAFLDYGLVMNFTIKKYLNLFVNISANNIGVGGGFCLPLGDF